jgi:hypothetical protein
VNVAYFFLKTMLINAKIARTMMISRTMLTPALAPSSVIVTRASPFVELDYQSFDKSHEQGSFGEEIGEPQRCDELEDGEEDWPCDHLEILSLIKSPHFF